MLAVAEVEKVSIEEGYTVTIVHVPIMPGVVAKICDGKTMELCVGKAAITVDYNSEVKDLIENIDEFEAVELLALLAEHSRDE